MESIRVSAKTLDDAITKACIELGAASEALGYEVIETGSKGVLGIGARPYVLHAWKKEETPEPEIRADEASLTEENAQPEKKAECEKTALASVQEKKAEKEEPVYAGERERKTQPAFNEHEKSWAKKAPVRETVSEGSSVTERAALGAQNPLSEEKRQELLEKAVAFLKTVFDGMGIEVQIKATWEAGGSELSLELAGDDMGVLIGKRGQTLDALQYLTSQVINKHQNEYVRLKLDTENYRERRRETLETLARNIAYKVRRTKRPVALEPMNPYERRIIHSVLQAEKDITTRSEGEEPYRHVVICCVRKKR